MAPEAPPKAPSSDLPDSGYRGIHNPDRRTVRARADARSTWVWFHDHTMRELCRITLAKLPADADEERRTKLKAGCNFAPYVRDRMTRPRKVELRRLRRIIKRRLATPIGKLRP